MISLQRNWRSKSLSRHPESSFDELTGAALDFEQV